MTKLDAGLITSLPASDPGSAAVWGSKRINSRPQFCLCLAWSGCPSNDDHCNTLHSTFCSPFSSLELSTAISQLSTSTSSGPDQITYPLLFHLPQSALHFLLYIFNLSWSTHTFLSVWKQSTIIPILKPGKPSDSPSSYRPISLTSCTSKLFERMVLRRLTYFFEQQDILSPVQAGFRPVRSTVDQVLLLSQSIADSFHQSKPGARTVLATVDFAKAFD